MTKNSKYSTYQRPQSEDVAKCEYCGELCHGYAHIVAGRAFCKLPSTCSEEWAWNFEEHLRKTEVA
jgi:hypothetical protein